MNAKQAAQLALDSQQNLLKQVTALLLERVRAAAEGGAMATTVHFPHPPPEASVKGAVDHLKELGYECSIVKPGSAIAPGGSVHVRWGKP